MPGLLRMRPIGVIAVGLGFVASSCGLIGGLSAAGAATAQLNSTAAHSTTKWTGNGTTNGVCDSFSAGLAGIPTGDQGWQFVLTSPDPGPWELTATFAHSGITNAAGTQNGKGSIHFVVITVAHDQLLSASSTNGGNNLVVGGCTLGATTTTTTVCPYGPCTQPSTVTPTSSEPGKPVGLPGKTTRPSSVAFTGAELGLLFTIGAVAIGVGGMLILVSRRRRSHPEYEHDGPGRR